MHLLSGGSLPSTPFIWSMRFLSTYFCLVVLYTPLLVMGQTVSGPEEVPVWQATPSSEVGMPYFFEHFSRQDYRQHHQNWAFAQDKQGLIYVANYDGILVYDGAHWRTISTPTNNIVRSLAVDEGGVVHAGVQGDFGYLRPDSTGTMQFVSLLDQVKPEDRDFTDVWNTLATDEGVYFQTTERLFRWDGDEMKVWNSEPGFHTAHVVYGQLYVREFGVGLLQMKGDALQPMPDGRRFADLRVYMMAPYAEGQTLIATREAGLFLYNGVSAKAFSTEIDAFLEEFRLYHGTTLAGGRYALSTLDGGGIVVIDAQGRVVQRLNESIMGDWVNAIFVDRQGGLWIALDNQGVVRADVPSALSKFNADRGLEGYIADIERHQGRLYIATTTGVYEMDQEPVDVLPTYQEAGFKRIYRGKSWILHSKGDVLFAGTDQGLFAIREREEPQQVEGISEPVYEIQKSVRHPGQLYLGSEKGVSLLEETASGWRVRNRIKPIEESVISVEETANGDLWVGTEDGKVIKFPLQGEGKEFTSEDGLPERVTQFFATDEDLILASTQGLYKYKENTDGGTSFYRDPVLNATSAANPDSLLTFYVEESGTFWLVYSDRIEIARQQEDGSYTRETPAVLRFPKANVVQLYVEEDGIAWIGNGADLIRYDPHIQKPYDAPFSALVRQVESPSTGRVLYGGTPVPDMEAPVFENVHNDLRFEVGARSYNDVSGTQYQYYLEGRDEEWSAWTSVSVRTYNDLRGRSYTFRVRARNAQGVISDETVFAFRLLPPWYLTWWAFALYGIMLLVAAAMYWRYYTVMQENKRAQEQARELARERHINERLQQANGRLQEANESLTQVNKLKDEFLANTSHELRTPLTAILGFSSILKEELTGQYDELIDPIESNGQRLLLTVNSLLDIAKLRSGMMELQRTYVDVGEKVTEILRLLKPLARQKNLPVELRRPAKPVSANLDPRYLDRILYNIIGNAIKFTEEGQVQIVVEQKEATAVIRVIDTGIGIEEQFIPHIFDEFKQESTGLSRSYEGSGLGLAITSRLVNLMEGTIEVESEKGVGSTFTVIFPALVPTSLPTPSVA
ncbi:MAG TPA: ATP-binding protein [Rhodothermales bacterium]|nr:ATP-binding protein [Rhodothermales bacterium]